MDSVRQERIEQKNFFDKLYHSNQMLEIFASTYGVSNIYKDSNLQQLQQSLYLGLTFQPSRNSYDAIDDYGNFWELKSLDISKNIKGFSTASHLTNNVLDRYRKCFFAFSFYEATMLSTIYVMHPLQLAEIWNKFNTEISNKKCLNNPKIPYNFVIRNGLCVYNKDCNVDFGNGIVNNAESIYASEQINLLYSIENGDTYANDI